MSTKLAMVDQYDEEPPPEVEADLSCSRNIIGDDDDWIIVKKQRITISIPPLSPDAASPQEDMPKISTKQCNITRSSKWNGDATRKKHSEQLSAKKSRDSPPGDGSRKKALESHSESILHKGITKMMVEISPHSPAVPVVKSAVSSHVANKIMRARILERRVAGLGGLKNWLFDCGLGWFIDILDSEKLGMYQLVSLTMNQLKEMGLVAVGPRRKLIHAIDSLSRPHPFELIS